MAGIVSAAPPPDLRGYTSADNRDGTYDVPLFGADVPDVAVERVPAAESGEGRDVYYMISTTMHLSPGAPIMRSYDLVSWEIVSYVFGRPTLADAFALRNGRSSYGQGQWASSLRYHAGTFYVLFNTNDLGGAYLYSTDDIESGTWTRTDLGRRLHDPSLFFDDGDGGTPYVIYGSGSIGAVRLSDDLTRAVEDFPNILDQDDYPGASWTGGLFEGAQAYRIDGVYYIATIAWHFGRGGRQVVLFRADELLGRHATADGSNPYEARVVLDSDGFAQGSLVPVARQAGGTDWHGMFFRDTFPVGRIPALIPAEWTDGWPVFADDGVVEVGDTFAKPIRLSPAQERLERQKSIVASDDFDNDAHLAHLDEEWDIPEPPDDSSEHVSEAAVAFNGSRLDPVWQWNHAPDNRYWSLTDRRGWLRLTTGHVVTGDYVYEKLAARDALTWFEEARNTLSQRVFGPTSSAETRLDVSGMNDGDVAGLAAYNRDFAYAAVKRVDGRNTLGVVRRLQPFDASIDQAAVEAFVPGTEVDLADATEVHIKVDADFVSTAGQGWVQFRYSLDGRRWGPLGEPVGPLRRDGALSHFMGHRFGLFAYSTLEAGGHVDFDHYLLSDTLTADGAAIDTGLLDAAIVRAQQLDRHDYPADAWRAMRVELQKAEAARGRGFGTQNQVDAPARALSLQLARLDVLAEPGGPVSGS
ncbi:glycoside hydrolase 43 family protein [Promicromonospora sp. NPDC057138]|uniref:glycoside hydrolase family 43 protein n=1 Tax=Promicromonospora sp. NPDC057138 TaxID=3346031 RepID=UPI00363D17FB